jgi:hypothetical protein
VKYYEGKYGLLKINLEVVRISLWTEKDGPNQELYFYIGENLYWQKKKDFVVFSDDIKALEAIAKIKKEA